MTQIVRDAGAERARVVVGYEGSVVQLRPIGGGPWWEADPGDIQPVTRAELLSPKVREVNARSVRGRP